MSCKCCREIYNKYCCPCLQTNHSQTTLPDLPRDIAETLADTNISTAPTPIDNKTIITETIINDNPKNTYGTEPDVSVQSRKIEFSIDNDYIRKSADSIDMYSPRTAVSDDRLTPQKSVV